VKEILLVYSGLFRLLTASDVGRLRDLISAVFRASQIQNQFQMLGPDLLG
jgi:hypothetical protein